MDSTTSSQFFNEMSASHLSLSNMNLDLDDLVRELQQSPAHPNYLTPINPTWSSDESGPEEWPLMTDRSGSPGGWSMNVVQESTCQLVCTHPGCSTNVDTPFDVVRPEKMPETEMVTLEFVEPAETTEPAATEPIAVVEPVVDEMSVSMDELEPTPTIVTATNLANGIDFGPTTTIKSVTEGEMKIKNMEESKRKTTIMIGLLQCQTMEELEKTTCHWTLNWAVWIGPFLFNYY